MNENHKFVQIWGFRRNADSSSDDSKSNPDKGSQELVPNLVYPDNDRVSETENQHVEVEKKTKRTHKVAPKKENKKKVKSKPKKDKKEVKIKPKKDSRAASSTKRVGNSSKKKKSKFINEMTIYDDFRIFTKSIMDDLRVARETMFTKMRKEMDQLLNSTPSSRSARKKRSESIPSKKLNQKPRARKPTKPKQKNELAASKGPDLPQEQVENENTNDPSNKNSILIDSSAKKRVFKNTPDQIVTSSTYTTVPLVLSNSRSNDTSLNLERGNYSGISFGHNSTESSYVGNGYPVGLNHHQRIDNSNNFGIPNRVVQGLPHDISLLGTMMMNGGGIRYTSGLSGHTLPNHLGSSSFRNLYPN